jgi:hypothetical protein
MNGRRTTLKLGMVLAAALSIPALVACGDSGAPTNPTAVAKDAPTSVTEQPAIEPTLATSDSWMTFSSEAGGFSIDMPGEPQMSTRSTDSPLGEVTFHFYQLSDGSAQYVVSYNDYPVPLEQLDAQVEVLDDAIQGAAQGNEMENVQAIEVQGNPGMEGETTIQGQHVWYRAILVENRMYQLIASSPESAKDASAFCARRFIESFTLLD